MTEPESPWWTAAGASAPTPPPLPTRLPDRSTTVLVLGIVGLLLCFRCGLIAAVIGSGDLRAMRNGTRDDTGESRTRTGMILGIVGAIVNGLIAARILAIWWR